jgi:endonuclease-3
MTAKAPERTQRARSIHRQLAKLYPDARCALNYQNPLQLLVATILSAQCTDAMVNRVTPHLFARFPDAPSLASADLGELESLIRSTGFFRNKAKNIKACCQLLMDRFGGEVPRTLEELIQLPGVARKTANVVLGECFSIPGITVDTHVGRLARRMGLTHESDPTKVERDLNQIIPKKDWTLFSHRMILHGRNVCSSRKPHCHQCAVAPWCPKIGVSS